MCGPDLQNGGQTIARRSAVKKYTCRDKVLEVARQLAQDNADGTFTVAEVVIAMREQKSKCSDGTVRAYMLRKMIQLEATTGRPPDLIRVSTSRYRLSQP